MSVHSNPPISHASQDVRVATGPVANIKALPTAGQIDPGSLGRQPAVRSIEHVPPGSVAVIGRRDSGANPRRTDVRRDRMLKQMHDIATSAGPASSGRTPISRGYAISVQQHEFLLRALMPIV